MATSENTPAPRATASKAVAPNLKAPTSSVAVATELARFIKEKRLSSNIQGKEYVQVEGWQFAGSQLGIVPILGEVLDLSTSDELRYRASVSLFDLHNKLSLGGGVAECSNKERTKRGYERYAICSMAQTRAVGKAYRNVLAWLIKAAGFEATPYEEMLDVVPANEAGTGAVVVTGTPQGNDAGASPTPSEPPVMHAESNSAAPADSAGAEQSDDTHEVILADYRAQMARATNTKDLGDVWSQIPGQYARQLVADKDAAKARIQGAVAQAAATPVRPQPAPAPAPVAPEAGNIKEAGSDTTLAEAVLAHAAECEETLPMTAEQKQHIYRLLDNPTITRAEKTKTLLGINKLGYNGARRALSTLRAAIDEREKSPVVTPAERTGNVRAQIAALLQANEGKLEIEDEGRLRAALSNPALTYDELEIELRWGREAAWDAESDGTGRESAEAEKIAA